MYLYIFFYIPFVVFPPFVYRLPCVVSVLCCPDYHTYHTMQGRETIPLTMPSVTMPLVTMQGRETAPRTQQCLGRGMTQQAPPSVPSRPWILRNGLSL